MERFEGYVVKSMKTSRVARRIVARQSFGRVRFFIRLLLLVLTAFYFATAAPLYATATVLPFALTIPFWILLGLWVLYAIVFTLLRPLAKATPEKMTELATQYVRGLLTDTLIRFREELLAVPEYGKELFSDARVYAVSYIPDAEERDALIKKGALRERGEQIRRGYEMFLRQMIAAESEGNRRYLEMRANMDRTIEKWRRRHLPNYDKVQVLLIEQNLTRLRREITDRREEFVRTNGVAAYIHLLEKVTTYEDPNYEKPKEKDGFDFGRIRVIPRKEICQSFREIVKQLKGYRMGRRFSILRGDELIEFKRLLDAYVGYAEKYTFVGCETLEIEDYRKRYERAVADQKKRDKEKRCRRCYTKLSSRYLCPECGRKMCPNCGGQCDCGKSIGKTIVDKLFF